MARAVAVGTEQGALIDLATPRGLYIRATGDVVTVEKGGKVLFRGTAAETHRWLRDPRHAGGRTQRPINQFSSQ
jgi:hypothetical protein